MVSSHGRVAGRASGLRLDPCGRIAVVRRSVGAARGERAEVVRLTVTSNDDPARRFPQRMRFATTGTAAPYRNDPTLL